MTKIEKLEMLTKGIHGPSGQPGGSEDMDSVMMLSNGKSKVKKMTMEKVRKILHPLTMSEGSELEDQGSGEGANMTLDTAVEKLRNVTGNFEKAKIDEMSPPHERKRLREERKIGGAKSKAPKAQASSYKEMHGRKFYDPTKVSRRKLSAKLPKSEGGSENLEKQPPAAGSPMGQMFSSIRTAFGGGQKPQAAPQTAPPPPPPPQPKNPWTNLAGLGKGPLPDDGMSFKDMKNMEKQQGGITVPLTSMKEAFGGKGPVTSKPKVTPTTKPASTTKPTTQTTSEGTWANLGQRMTGKK